MNTSLLLASRQIRRAPARVAAVFFAAMLSAMAIMGTGTFTETMLQATRLSVSAPLSEADVIVESRDGDLRSNDLRNIEGVAAAEAALQSGAEFTIDGEPYPLQYSSAYATGDLQWFKVESGRIPESADEFALSTQSAAKFGLSVGDSVPVQDWNGNDSEVTLVGLLDLPEGTEMQPLAFMHPDAYETGETVFAVETAPGGNVAQVVDNINSTFGTQAGDENADIVASDGASYVNNLIDQMSGGSNLLAIIFAIFAAIATIAASMVIRNTFQVLLAQRLREIGLLRLVGASSKQVQQTVLVEALLIGLAGAIAGIIAGIGLGYLVAALAGMAGAGLVVPIGWALSALVVTLTATLTAAWAPAVSVRNLPPIAALSAAALTERNTERSSRRAWIVGTVLTLIGAAGLTAAAVIHELLIALLAGVIAAIGLIILVPLLVSRITPLIARMLAPLGPVAKLAGENLVRTSRRSGTVVLAIALGGSLVISMLTAASTVVQSATVELNKQFPLDAVVATSDGSPLTEAQLNQVRALDHVDAVIPVTGVPLDPTANADLPVNYLLAVPETMRDRLAEPISNGDLLVSPESLDLPGGLRDGDQVQVARADGNAVTLTVHAEPMATSASLGSAYGVSAGLVSEETLASFGGDAQPTQVWIDLKDGDTATSLVEELTELTKSNASLVFGGTVQIRAIYETLTYLVVGFVLAMMALTIVISALGLASVVALSVTERGREIALLRALGVQRQGVRTMVMVESISLALIGAALSLIIGIPLGIAAVYSAVASNDVHIAITLPWLGIVALIAVALAIGVIAAIGPAIRASRIAPAAALARVE